MIVSPDFLTHRKTRRLVMLLGGYEAAPLLIIRLWGYCQAQKNSRFPGMTSTDLLEVCEYAGDAATLEQALLTAKFIRREAGALIVHEWDEHNSSLVANWINGRRGGRPPKKPNHNPTKPTGNPTEPLANPPETDKRREDQTGEEKNSPLPPLIPPAGEEDFSSSSDFEASSQSDAASSQSSGAMSPREPQASGRGAPQAVSASSQAPPTEPHTPATEDDFASPPGSKSSRRSRTGSGKIMSEETAINRTRLTGIPEDFARYIYQDWACREGCDAGGVRCQYILYVAKRWAREGPEWTAGNHHFQLHRRVNLHAFPNSNSNRGRISATHDPSGTVASQY